MLVGRAEECRRIDELLAAARHGRSGALVLLGEPGIGKTALLQHAADAGADLECLSARGIESESELAFSSLADLLRPLSGNLEQLPAPRRKRWHPP
ncbi:MAG: ATP-binding protein [Gaiellaceae bacterium]